MLVTQENSYLTIEEADQYLEFEVQAPLWEILEPYQKARFLVTAARSIDSLALSGDPLSPEQPLAFPRSPQQEVPAQVKAAQALEALALADPQAATRRELRAQGVAAVTLGKASESYAPPAGGALCSTRALRLLRPWLEGSVTGL